jgi:hypothetical protein
LFFFGVISILFHVMVRQVADGAKGEEQRRRRGDEMRKALMADDLGEDDEEGEGREWEGGAIEVKRRNAR